MAAILSYAGGESADRAGTRGARLPSHFVGARANAMAGFGRTGTAHGRGFSTIRRAAGDD